MRARRPGWSRRDLLHAAPGLAASLALGCGPRTGPEFSAAVDLSGITGAIVGADDGNGHLLRSSPLAPLRGDGGLPEPREVREVAVLIAGAGIAGLAAGWKLHNSGMRDFEILELEKQAGGNARWGENAVSAYPWGAHYLPLPTPESTAVRELLDEMGMILDVGEDGAPIYDPRHLCHDPQERVFLDDRWQDGLSARAVMAPGEAAELAKFERQIAVYRDYRDARGRRAFTLPMALSSDAGELRELDGLSMRQFFDRAGWRSDRLRWYVDYCCRDDYGCTLDTTSAWAGWHYFCSRSEAVEYLTWPEGNGRIVRHFLERLGSHLRTGMLVYRIRPNARPPGSEAVAAGAEVDVLDVRTHTAVRFRARHVICALPRFTVPYVVEGYDRPGSEEFTYSPWMVANLTVRRPPQGAAWDNVLHHSRSLGYVVATHQSLRVAPGPSVLTYYLPLTDPDPAAARRRMLATSWDGWAATILADLAGAHPDIESLVTHVDVMLWGHAMIRPVPGFIHSDARRRAAEPFGPVRFAHSDLSGLSLFEEAQYHGVRAAEDLLRQLGHPFHSSLGPAERL
ncbi:MAG: FAD-dependent oxidoreductase [Thermoanaerobaculia bacterium]